ncbi:MAG: hypothetical protein KAG89_10730 [Fulvimarina manganoxydans]|uniref:hypothetical protein n=1 Tax=Fulvimarina manganoxydans TaxID=937218 RepID=UPI0023555C40|nr:hypothetical protein [Fulvimarina manganoxydans]MCK5932632.1 hypothetical protein [Fulvimarina manganoxydans]
MAWHDLLILGTLIAVSAALYFGATFLMRSVIVAAEALFGAGQGGKRVQDDAHPFLSLAMRRRQAGARHTVSPASVFSRKINPSRKINQPASLIKPSAALGGGKSWNRTVGDVAPGVSEGKARSRMPFEASRSAPDR